MEITYTCRKCGKVFTVERQVYQTREESYEELLSIGEKVLFPHFEHHYPVNIEEYRNRFIVFVGSYGRNINFNDVNYMYKELGIDVAYPLVVTRSFKDPNKIVFAS